MRVLYVEDEEIKRTTVVHFLNRHNHETTGVETAEEALVWLSLKPCDVLIADVRLPGMEGTELLTRVRKEHPDVTVFMVTGYATVDLAVEVMRQGAYDFLTKPFKNEVLLLKMERIEKFKRRTRDNWELRHATPASSDLPGLLAHSDGMRRIVELIHAVGPGPSTVLILGESGTGKERVARALHIKSSRPDGPFVAFNCAALPADLVENELFGHEDGSGPLLKTRVLQQNVKFQSLLNQGWVRTGKFLIPTPRLEFQSLLNQGWVRTPCFDRLIRFG